MSLVPSLALWPSALTFMDETGYVGHTRLMLQQRLAPLPDDPGLWARSEGRTAPKYPPAFPALLAPLFALHPRAAFLTGAAALSAIVLTAGAVLASWRRSPWWALVVAGHPAVVLLSRTLMVDLTLSALIFGGWWAGRRGRDVTAAVLLASAVAIKPTGAVAVAALIVGEVLRTRMARRRAVRDDSVSTWAWVLGGVGGLAAALIANRVTTGLFRWGYVLAHDQVDAFSWRYLATSGPVYLLVLLAGPPLLAAGVIPLVRRRELGVAGVAVVFPLLMSVYYFVDRGATLTETLVLGPRLILPAVVVLLVGYADLLAGATQRLGIERAAVAALAVLVASGAAALSVNHHRWHAEMRAARAEAERRARAEHDGELGLTYSAFKAGLVSPLPVRWVRPGRGGPCVALCAMHTPSHRDPVEVGCDLPGYGVTASIGPYRVLRREDCRAAAADP